ncbi:MAG TPA: TM2 domain-containing protein [Acholeplasmataceae bacterium]|nr:TM2 domain-containing protein [Acholeplasmataceae bacterium]
MDDVKVDAYIMANGKYFPNNKVMMLRDRLLQADESKYSLLLSLDLKEPTTMLLISIFLGYLGIDRFMLGDIGMGILKLLTFGLCGVLTIVDWFLISDKTKEQNLNKIMQIL